jgi:hypothetical protein
MFGQKLVFDEISVVKQHSISLCLQSLQQVTQIIFNDFNRFPVGHDRD